MSEIQFKGKAPSPQVHDGRSLQIRQGSPAYSHAAPSNSKTEIAPIARQHTMGAKSAVQAPRATQTQGRAAPANVLKREQTTAGLKNTAGGARAGAPGSVSSQKSPTTKATAQTAAPSEIAERALALLLPPASLLLGQLLEMFIAGEQMGPNRDSIYVQIASQTLTELAPFLPEGVTIPVPNIPIEMVIPSPAPTSHAPAAPSVTIVSAAPAPAPAATAAPTTTPPTATK